MSYLKLVVNVSESYQEHVIAELMDMDFYGFEQQDDHLVAYVEKRRFNDANREYIEQMIGRFPDASFVDMTDVQEENWNATWEDSIQPQTIGKFLVKPSWSDMEPASDQILLVVDPKMSFGTGYHHTTRLMLRQLEKIDCGGKRVLDAGTGTGILAIAACKLGADRAIGFDFDPWSERNATENAHLNNVGSQLDIRLGGFEQVKNDKPFDIVLANINRNVILEFLPDIVSSAVLNGTICLSGLLETDEDAVRDALQNYPVRVTGIEQEKEWILLQLEKTSS